MKFAVPSSDIRRELDDTRSELKRGAFDLPEEAKESAAAMAPRRIEQIKALQTFRLLWPLQPVAWKSPVHRANNACNDTVAAPATAAPAPMPQPPRAQPPRAEAQPPQQRIEAQPQRAPVAPQQPAPPRANDFAGGLRGSLPIDRPAPHPAPAQAPAPSAQRKPEAAPQRSETWAGSAICCAVPRVMTMDMRITRRSSDTQHARRNSRFAMATAVTPRHMVESLNSLSVDIARAIDHDASVISASLPAR